MSKSKPITAKEAEKIEERILKDNPDKKPVPLGNILSKIGKKEYGHFVFDENGKVTGVAIAKS